MMLTSWDPFRHLHDVARTQDFRSTQKDWSPAANVSEEESGYVLRFDVPGVAKDKIDIDIDRDVLVVSGEREKITEETSGERYHRIESRSGSFRRSFRLPEDADLDSVSANHKDGVLTIRVPRAAAARPRKIEVAAA